MSIYEILNYLFMFFFGFILFPIGTAIYRWKELSQTDRLVVYYLILLLLNEIISDILRYSYMRNHYMHYSLTILSLFFSAFYFSRIIIQAKAKKILYFYGLVLLLFIPIEVFFINGFNQINFISETLMFLGMVIFSCFSIYHLLKNKISKPDSNKTTFAILTGFLLIGLFSFVSSYFKKQFIESSLDLYYFFKMLSVIGSATAFILFAIGFWIKSKNAVTEITK